MPYDSIENLPDNVKNHLPKYAQEIYLKAFNNAWEEYQDPSKRRDDQSLEEVSHKVAWSAVKKKFRKDSNNNWVEI